MSNTVLFLLCLLQGNSQKLGNKASVMRIVWLLTFLDIGTVQLVDGSKSLITVALLPSLWRLPRNSHKRNKTVLLMKKFPLMHETHYRGIRWSYAATLSVYGHQVLCFKPLIPCFRPNKQKLDPSRPRLINDVVRISIRGVYDAYWATWAGSGGGRATPDNHRTGEIHGADI